MKKQDEFMQSNVFRVLVGISIAYSIVAIFKAGYATGQWLFVVLK